MRKGKDNTDTVVIWQRSTWCLCDVWRIKAQSGMSSAVLLALGTIKAGIYAKPEMASARETLREGWLSQPSTQNAAAGLFRNISSSRSRRNRFSTFNPRT